MTEADYKNVKSVIYSNILDSMGTILINMKKLAIQFENYEREVRRFFPYKIHGMMNKNRSMFRAIVEHCYPLCHSTGSPMYVGCTLVRP